MGIGVLGALNYCLPVFSFGEVLAKEGVEGYRETEVWDFDARISYEPDEQKLLELLETHRVTFVWVRGHKGHPYNERCDALAVEAASRCAEGK